MDLEHCRDLLQEIQLEEVSLINWKNYSFELADLAVQRFLELVLQVESTSLVSLHCLGQSDR